MKKLLSGLMLAAALSASAQLPTYQLTTHYLGAPAGSTNNLDTPVDLTQSTVLGFNASYTGVMANRTAVLLGITNAPSGSIATQTVMIALGGFRTNTYTWTNNVTTNVLSYASNQTLLVIAVTSNPSGIIATQTLAVAGLTFTNIYTFTNSVSNPTQILAGASGRLTTTNLFSRLNYDLPAYGIAVSYGGPTNITLITPTNNNLTVTMPVGANAWGTNGVSTFFAVTNSAATNALQLQSTNTVNGSMTNLYAKLTADFPGLNISYAGPAVLQLVTPLSAPFTVSMNMGNTGWATNQITTNNLVGAINLVASNTIDKILWFRDPQRDLSLAVNTNLLVSLQTNWTGLGAIGYETWSIQNAGTNYFNAGGLQITTTVKKGL